MLLNLIQGGRIMEKVSPLREQMISAMKLRNMSPLTITVYVRIIRELSEFYGVSPDTLKSDEVQAYLVHLNENRQLSYGSMNVAFASLRFFYGTFLRRNEMCLVMPRRKGCKTLPRILTLEEVMRIIRSGSTLKHRTFLLTVYGCGLRVGEACRLRPENICADDLLVRVDQGKGNKDRYTLLPQRVLEELRNYWRVTNPGEWIFPGRDKTCHFSKNSAQDVYYKSVKRSGVKGNGGIHILRHCFATHLLKAGWDVYTISRFMGHRSLATTSRYLNFVNPNARKQKNPLDAVEDWKIHPSE